MRLCFALLLELLFAQGAFAYTGFSICNYGKETVPTVICYGPAVLKGTTVSGDLKVAGQLTAVNISAGSLSITGDADIQNSKISGTVEATGRFSATNVTFQKGLTLTSSYVLLHKTNVKGDVIISSSSDTPHLVMECGTLVTGVVKFIGKAGIIEITDDSIIQGKIGNGSMIFEKKKC